MNNESDRCRSAGLPNGTLLRPSHGGAAWTIERLCELFQIRNSADHTELCRTMTADLNTKFQHFRPVFATPYIGGTDPEQLIRCVLQAGQCRLDSVILYVCLISLF